MRNKKAEIDADMMKNLIFIALGLIVMLAVIYYAFGNIEKEADIAACHDTIYSMEWAASKFPEGDYYVKEFPSACNPNHIVIEEENEEDVKARILMLMDQCFWTYGEGRFYPFDKSTLIALPAAIAAELGVHNVLQFWGENSCAVCSTFELKNFEGSISPNDMFTHIMKTNTKDGISFGEHFNYYAVADAFDAVSITSMIDADNGIFISTPIGKGNVYTIIFASSQAEPKLGHPMIDIIGRTSNYCYPT